MSGKMVAGKTVGGEKKKKTSKNCEYCRVGQRKKKGVNKLLARKELRLRKKISKQGCKDLAERNGVRAKK